MKKILTAFLLIVFFSGCARNSTGIRLEPEEAFNQAKREFNLKHYDKAIEKFKIVIFDFARFFFIYIIFLYILFICMFL